MTASAGSSPSETAVEVALVKLHADATPADRSRIEAKLTEWRATTLVAADWGWVVQLPERGKALLRADRAVALVGGIQSNARKVPRIRVPASGV